MDTEDKLSWVALTAVSGVGTKTIQSIQSTLIKHDISWSEFWELKAKNLAKMSITEKLINRIITFRKEHTIYTYSEWLSNSGISTLIKGQSDYPSLLARSEYSPLVLFRKGIAVKWNQQPVVAVVGTRQMTAYGHLVTTKISKELSQLGATVVSGFMYGVDVTAHSRCLEVGGITVGVLGYGFEYCYPTSQQQLMKEMLDQGMTFITPFAPHIAPRKGQFVARNRVVAGMSHAVVVTEAAEKSGSHITAGYAADEGKVVCAVPGPITNPYSAGTKALINQGAVLVQSGKEILEECSFSTTISSLSHLVAVEEQPNPIEDILRTGSFSLEELLKISKLQYAAVISMLTELELSGAVKKEGNKWNLIS